MSRWCVRDKNRGSEIDSSQRRHEAAFWWCHNGPVTSQATDLIKWPISLKLNRDLWQKDTCDKIFMTPICRTSTLVQLWFIYFITVTSLWARRRLKSPAYRLFPQPCVQAEIKENTKAPHYWPLTGEFPHKGPVTRIFFSFDDAIMFILVGLESW